MLKYIVITTINNQTEAVSAYAGKQGWKLILIGDRKGPESVNLKNVDFYNIHSQEELDFSYVNECPYNHYARKNIGYLLAIRNNASVIADTDDDNIPMSGWGEELFFGSQQIDTCKETGCFNVYMLGTDMHVWPRGFPLDSLDKRVSCEFIKKKVRIGIWQHLVDNHPDVDAILRLSGFDKLVFNQFPPLALMSHTYCPINSQNTFWCKDTFPLLYLPMTVSFRFTDILRGYIAQRIAWESGYAAAFGAATAWQNRNEHNIYKDFMDELPMYKVSRELINILESLNLPDNMSDALIITYEALIEKEIAGKEEIKGLEAWLRDIEEINTETIKTGTTCDK